MYGGPAPFGLKEGHRYYVIFIDDFSRYTWLYFVTSRSEVLSIYERFATVVHTQFSTPICVFLADSAREYISQMLHGFLVEQGTLSQSPVLALMLRMAWLSVSIVTCLRRLVLRRLVR
jgi:hypothetical protein